MKYALIVILLLLPMVPTFWAIVDIAYRDFKTITRKMTWGILVVLIPCLGGIAYLIFGRKQGRKKEEYV
nr:PLDc_N domain-containing protein [Desulfobacterales bacterium]